MEQMGMDKVGNDMENLKPPEEIVPEISTGEWQEFCTLPPEDPKLVHWMEEKGIEFDQGDVPVTYDGKKAKMVTDRNDFGTIIEVEGEEEQLAN